MDVMCMSMMVLLPFVRRSRTPDPGDGRGLWTLQPELCWTVLGSVPGLLSLLLLMLLLALMR